VSSAKSLIFTLGIALWISLTYIKNRIITIYPCGSWRSKGVPYRTGVPYGTGLSLRLLVGELGPQNLPKFSPMANGYTHTEYYFRSGPKLSENAQFWGRMYIPWNIFAHTSKITPKPHFGDLSMQNLLYRELSVSRVWMELRSWKFTVI